MKNRPSRNTPARHNDQCKWWLGGVGENNIPWMDDLYLDIIILPSGEVIQQDADELEEAWEESARINALVKNGEFHLLRLSEEHKDLLLNRL